MTTLLFSHVHELKPCGDFSHFLFGPFGRALTLVYINTHTSAFCYISDTIFYFGIYWILFSTEATNACNMSDCDDIVGLDRCLFHLFV